MNYIILLFLYIFEQFVAYIYCNNKFIKKVSNSKVLIAYSLSFLVQYLVYFLDIPILNLLGFLLLNGLILFLCFKTTTLQALFNSVLLTAIMAGTEVFIIFIITYILKIDLSQINKDNLVLFITMCLTKSLYFFITYLFSKISIKESNKNSERSFALILVPISSIITMIAFTKISEISNFDDSINIIFVVVCLIQLFSNVAIFLLHEKVIKTIKSNAELKLEAEKAEIQYAYYTEIEKQNERSSILVHDIKNCLTNIKSLSNNSNNEEVIDYINSIYKIYSVEDIKQYTNNKLLNTIISRYANECSEKSIEFSADIRNINFSFLDDAELTALFDNLLQNSYEAAVNAEERFINLIVDIRNENYVIIKLSNSSSKEPKIIDDNLITTKSDYKIHGIGTKSIKKIVTKHNGSIAFNYDNESKVFTATIILAI